MRLLLSLGAPSHEPKIAIPYHWMCGIFLMTLAVSVCACIEKNDPKNGASTTSAQGAAAGAQGSAATAHSAPLTTHSVPITASGAASGAVGTSATTSGVVSLSGSAPLVSPNIYNPLVQWSAVGAGGPLALVQTTTTDVGISEITYVMPYAMLTRNPNGQLNTSYLLSAYNYDPCIYESAHGPLTMPPGGRKVELFAVASQGDGAPWLLPGGSAVLPSNLAQARYVAVDSNTGSVSQMPASGGNLNLVGATAGGSGKSFASGTGTVDATFSDLNQIAVTNPAAPQISFNLVGAVLPQICGANPNTPAPQPLLDPCSPLDTYSLREGDLFQASARLYANAGANAGLPSSAQPLFAADTQSLTTLMSFGENAFGALPETDNATLFATITENASQSSQHTFVLSVYNYDPCDYEAKHGDLAMPVNGFKFESYLLASAGDGAPWLSAGATSLAGSAAAASRFVQASAAGCAISQTAGSGGAITLTGATAGGSGKFLPTGAGKIQAMSGAANSPHTQFLFGRFLPSVCKPLTSMTTTAKDPAACFDANSLRQASLF